LTVVDDGAHPPGSTEAAWTTVLTSLEASEQAMSRFRPTSDLTRLNRLAGTSRVSVPTPRLRQALVAADRARRITDGRFDPWVLTDLDRLGYRGADIGRPAGSIGAGSVGPGTDVARVVVRTGRARISLPQPVDLGGIGKGLGLRWAADDLHRLGWANVLLEAGGDLVGLGIGPDDEPWRVGLEDPLDPTEHLAVIEVVDSAVATSSVRVHRWVTEGRTVHHLLDPRTGEPADTGLLSVTVAGPDPAWAEVWSKVLFIGGRASIAAEARARGLAAWWVADDGSLEMTADARRRTAWVAAEDRPR
jgi:thiamine biosynthesis lipoprotein